MVVGLWTVSQTIEGAAGAGEDGVIDEEKMFGISEFGWDKEGVGILKGRGWCDLRNCHAPSMRTAIQYVYVYSGTPRCPGTPTVTRKLAHLGFKHAISLKPKLAMSGNGTLPLGISFFSLKPP